MLPASVNLLRTPSAPVPGNRLAQEPPPGSAVEFLHYFFYHGIGVFMVLVDAGQLFRCAGQHFMMMQSPSILTSQNPSLNFDF